MGGATGAPPGHEVDQRDLPRRIMERHLRRRKPYQKLHLRRRCAATNRSVACASRHRRVTRASRFHDAESPCRAERWCWPRQPTALPDGNKGDQRGAGASNTCAPRLLNDRRPTSSKPHPVNHPRRDVATPACGAVVAGSPPSQAQWAERTPNLAVAQRLASKPIAAVPPSGLGL
jgi:hypothetical protein